MKKYSLLSLFLLLLFACNQGELDQLNQEKSDLTNLNQGQDSIINDMLASFNEIQDNLNAIKEREGYIALNMDSENAQEPSAEQINKDIKLISELMLENEEKLAKLNQRLDQSNVKMNQFRRLIENLNRQVSEKNMEIAQLNEALAQKDLKINSLYFSIDTLKYSNKMKDKIIEEKTDEINTGYFAFGTFKELKEKGVISKEGGFLGLGKNETLLADFNTEYFSRVDIREQKSFLIYAKKAELVTKHPEGSYEFIGADKQVDSLVVLDPEAFWRASKYMVILVD